MSTKRRAYLTEMKTQLTLAVPALLAQIAMISMGFVDMVMTGRVGAVDMAAVALAGSLWVPLVLFGQGLLLAVTPCVAQLRGAGSMRSGEHMQGCRARHAAGYLDGAVHFGSAHPYRVSGIVPSRRYGR